VVYGAFSCPASLFYSRVGIVSRQGRFGKYGDMKRLERLRGSRTHMLPARAAPQHGRPARFRAERISIRRADLSDMNFIGRLSGRVFSVYGPYTHLVPAWFESGLTLTLVAVEKGVPVGFAMMGRFLEGLEKQETRCELLAIAVDPSLHRRGIGGMLLCKIEKEAERLGETALLLHTAVDNVPAQDLFKKNHFIPLSLKKHFYPAGQDAVMMIKAI
jgi:ribosomal protein S18 acetylase RimI-like enzyme